MRTGFIISSFSAVLLASALPCLAALGDTVASVTADQTHFQARMKSTQAQNYSVHEMTRDDGMMINEYVSSSGKVFGVSWQGPVIPDLSQLLGSSFSTFQDEVRATGRQARHRGAIVHRGDLVVESGGHPRDYRGRAYLVNLLPSNVTEAVIQ